MARITWADAIAQNTGDQLLKLIASLASGKNPDGTDYTMPVELNAASASVTLNVDEIDGLAITNGSGAPVPVSDNGGSFTVDAPSGTPVYVAFPSAQEVSGTVTANAAAPSGSPVYVAFPSAQAVSGTVTANIAAGSGAPAYVAFPSAQSVTGTTDPTTVTGTATGITEVGFTDRLGISTALARTLTMYAKNNHASASLDYQVVGAMNSSLAASAIVEGPFALAAGKEMVFSRRAEPYLYYEIQDRSTASASPASGTVSGYALPTPTGSNLLGHVPYSVPTSAAPASGVPVLIGTRCVYADVPVLNAGAFTFWYSWDGGTTKVNCALEELVNQASMPTAATYAGSTRQGYQRAYGGGPDLRVGCYSSVAQTGVATFTFTA